MKHILRFSAFFMLTLLAFKSQSQVTQLSNNTNIRSGIALGNIGVLADENGALWRTDGTAAGTVIFTSKAVIDTSVNTAILGGKIYFNGFGGGNGNELWVTDGTDAGTQLVKDIETGASGSKPKDLYVFNNTLYFFATTTAAGTELWKSDGTAAGTVMVKDINPGADNSYNNTYTSFFASANTLYFDANDGTHGTELWTTNGTEAGTVMIDDINPGAGSSNCQGFTSLNTNTILFSADDGTHGAELWKSNGSTAELVKDIVTGSTGSSPSQFVPFNNKMLFTVFTGAPLPTFKMYLTDGTNTGTVLVKDFGFGGVAILATSVIINNKLYFSASDLTHGLELWSTDATAGGTKIFDDINPGINSSGAFILPDFLSYINGSADIHTKLFNGKIFFIADDGTHGEELWITDGTVGNTHIVKDINPGKDSSINFANFPSWFYTANNFYFSADDGTTGTELYTTDGMDANTALVEDINPGSKGSDPFLFMFVNSHIYFTADNGDNENGDRDLYIIDAEVSLPVKLLDFTAATDDKVVNLNWSTATENNAKDFVVQRSKDAVHFDNIGTVKAKGNSTSKTDYSFTDVGAFSTGASTIYYRLQMVDNDGKSANSKIADVQVKPGGNFFVVYPNPVKDKLVIITNSVTGNAILKVTDQAGKVVLMQQMENLQPGAKNTINVSALANGIYHLQLISDSNKQTTEFIKY